MMYEVGYYWSSDFDQLRFSEYSRNMKQILEHTISTNSGNAVSEDGVLFSRMLFEHLNEIFIYFHFGFIL